MHSISFRPVTQADFAKLRGWMEKPHWRQWWGDPEEELAYIKEMIEGRDTTRPFIFAVDGQPVGYIQVWFISDQIEAGWAEKETWLTMVPANSVGVDLSIGEAENLDKGYGSATLRAFTLDLAMQGHQTILIDPDPVNLRAVRAYEKAGYRAIPELMGKTGGSLIMQFDIEQHEKDA
jgi:aminoglycoside 6'-N-acetyltransferase